MIDIHKKAFLEEAAELLSELETSLLEVEKNPNDVDLIARIFRALHTIKGSSGMFGYSEITAFTHDIENVYDLIRNGKLEITKQIIDITLGARDQILKMLNNENKSDQDELLTRGISSSFKKIMSMFNTNDEINNSLPQNSNVITGLQRKQNIYLINFIPEQNIFLSGTNPLSLVKELTSFGPAVVIGDFNNIPSFENLDPEKCYTSWEIILKTDMELNEIKDVFIFIEDQCKLTIELIDEQDKLKKDDDFNDFKNLIIDVAKNKKPEIKNLLAEFQSSASDITLNDSVGSKPSKKENRQNNNDNSVSSIRVSAEKLDELVNLVGELVTVQARLSQAALISHDQEFTSISEEVERITWSLRDSALNIRMLPIGTTFSKFKRLVRDLSKELGKEVELTTNGAETELDKTVIEKLNDPLIHIIRNSIDHGVETPEVRERKGKFSKGIISLSASQSGGNVIIKISDDGAGINKDAVKEKAINLGLIAENSNLSESEIYSLIFAPGFSTAEKVTNVSGRGVGMDVVRKAIESLRGTIEVSSKIDEGTTITLRLPLTLAIIDGLLVEIEDDNYILPLATVEECIELSKADIVKAHGRQLVNIRGGIVPYINLRSRFNIKKARPDIEQIVVVKTNGSRVGFVVDKVFGQHQTVLKSLGKFYKNVRGISGATILGNGTVALILDLQKIIDNEVIEDETFFH